MAKVDKQQQIQVLLKQAEDGARAVFESENYRNYLSTMSKFHNYSFRNTLLIYMQKPEASYVAGYVAWQKNFNRQVQKGEKGIQIVGYTPKNVNQEQEKRDEQGNPVIGADGKPETETVTRKIPYFTPVYVYDVSQTEGEPLPRLVNELDGNVESYNDLMTALREVSPFPIVFEDIKGGVNGYCSPAEQKIAVRQGMSEAQTVKTAIHEITHADLHAPEIDAALENRKDRRTKEVEAESTAFIVCNHYGIDTSDYSFGYLASWSSTKELTELQSSLDTIQKQANELIDRIDNRLAELQKDRPLEIANEAIDVRTAVAEQIEQRIKEVRKDYPTPAERSFSIYQLNATGRKYRFESLEVFGNDERPTLSMYDKVYEGKLPPTATLDNIFEQFNIERPADFTGHSLSVSDIIVIKDDGIISAYYVDRIGFESLPEFAQEIEVEHTVVNVDRLLAEAQKTPDYFKVKSAITGLPIDEKGYVSITALMDKTRGTDAYDAINKIFEEQQRRANETLDSVKLYRQHVSQLEKLYDDIKPQPVEHTVVNVDRLLAEAQKTPDYFKVKSAITGLPIDEKGYVSITALMDKTRGTDAYDAINKIFEEQQRRANETLDSVKFDNDIDLDMEKTREQLGFKDAAQPQTAADIFKTARDKAARINGDADQQQPEQQQKKDRNTERGE